MNLTKYIIFTDNKHLICNCLNSNKPNFFSHFISKFSSNVRFSFVSTSSSLSSCIFSSNSTLSYLSYFSVFIALSRSSLKFINCLEVKSKGLEVNIKGLETKGKCLRLKLKGLKLKRKGLEVNIKGLETNGKCLKEKSKGLQL